MIEFCDLWDEAETCRRIKIAPKTLQNWRVLGRGPKATKVGRLVRYDPNDVAAWLATRKIGSTSERVAA